MIPQVYISGPRAALNEVLAIHIKKNLGLDCIKKQDADIIDTNDSKKNLETLFLIDCSGKTGEDILTSVETSLLFFGNIFPYVALFNVDARFKDEIEHVAYLRGISGVFFEDKPLDLLLKGIQTIFDGELWFSRNSMSRLLKYEKNDKIESKPAHFNLTTREKEILKLIAAGCSNAEIADRLYISPHTVKTHLSNLFKKIEVPNRLQAALWAANRRLDI